MNGSPHLRFTQKDGLAEQTMVDIGWQYASICLDEYATVRD